MVSSPYMRSSTPSLSIHRLSVHEKCPKGCQDTGLYTWFFVSKTSAGGICKSGVPAKKPEKSFSVSRIDHLVLTVKDIDATVTFYSQVLGMDKVTFGEGRTGLAFGNQKLNLHQKGKEFEPKAANPTPGAIDICFITKKPIQSVVKNLESLDISVEEGPVKRTGANGPITSVYFRDPDKNLIEVSKYNHDVD